MRRQSMVFAATLTMVVAGVFTPPAVAEQAWEPLWQVVENGPGLEGGPGAFAVDTTGGGRVHITGSGSDGRPQILTYDATDGELLQAREGPYNSGSTDIAADPVTGAYFVTGLRLQSRRDEPPDGSAVAAYDRSGAALWDATIPDVRATAIAVDAARDRVYISGAGPDPAQINVIVAYRQSTGQLLWTRKPGAGSLLDLAVHPGTGMVVMGGGGGPLKATAYSSTGRLLWQSSIPSPSPGGARFTALSVASDGVYVMATGRRLFNADDDIDTVAYNLDGTLRWAAAYDGPAAGRDTGRDIAADPVSGTVVATGRQEYLTSTGRRDDQGVIFAYDADDGSPRWVRPEPPASDPPSLVLSNYPVEVDPVRGVVYAATRQDEVLNWTTSAYDVRTGQPIRSDLFDRPVGSEYFNQAIDIHVDEQSGRVFIAGEFTEKVQEVSHYVTMAYPPAR